MKHLSVLLAIGLLVAGKPGDGVPEKEPAKLDGKWERSSRQAMARIADWDTPGGQTFAFFIIGVNSKPVEIMGDKLFFQSGDKAKELKLSLDLKKSPMEVDAEVGKGEIVFRGIYEVGKDALRLCFSRKDRPKEFKNTTETPFLEFKRK